MDRRQFLIRAGAIAGQLLVPRFFERALAFVENHDEPLLEIPSDSTRELLVQYSEDGCFLILDGPLPTEVPEPISWREYLLRECASDFEESMAAYELTANELDHPMNEWTWEHYWSRNLCSNATAWDYLYGLDLGPEFGKSPGASGEIRFVDAKCIGNDAKFVEVDDFLSMSLLQDRLNQLGEKTSLRVDG